METLENTGTGAGIVGLASGAFLVLFRDAIRKSILSSLAGNPICKRIRPAFVLIRSVAFASIIICLVVPVIAKRRSAEQKVVVALDSPLFVYDEENQNNGRMNIDEIKNALNGLNGLIVYGTKTSLEWHGEGQVKSKNPDLITMHLSAFESENQSAKNLRASDQKMLDFFRYMADSKAKFLVYSRSPNLLEAQDQETWIHGIERRIPQLSNRISFFNFAGRPKRFRDPEVKRALRMQVKNILGIS